MSLEIAVRNEKKNIKNNENYLEVSESFVIFVL